VRLYPQVDVAGEVQQLGLWVIEKPQNRPKKHMKTFLRNCLGFAERRRINQERWDAERAPEARGQAPAGGTPLHNRVTLGVVYRRTEPRGDEWDTVRPHMMVGGDLTVRSAATGNTCTGGAIGFLRAYERAS
jgi:hypothetical protein